jgi:hypothetical protein
MSRRGLLKNEVAMGSNAELLTAMLFLGASPACVTVNVPPSPRASASAAPAAGPVATAGPVASTVYVVADGPYYRWVADRCVARGASVGMTFNTDFDAQLANAAGHTLVVALVGDRLVLPERYWPTETVVSVDLLRLRQAQTPRGIFTRQRSDGTTVYVLYGRDDAALREMVQEFSC